MAHDAYTSCAMVDYDRSAACACTTLRKAARAVARTYDEALAPCGMTTAQFAILRALSRRGPMPLSRLAEQQEMDRTSLYRALTPIETRGWVAIEAGSGKAKVATLSDEGRAAMEAAEPHWQEAQARIVGGMGSMWMELEGALKSVTALAQEER